MKTTKRLFSGLTANSFLLALTSLFADISSEMLYPILPIYLTQTLKARGSIVGIIEGIAETTQNLIQGVSGWFSDKKKKYKALAADLSPAGLKASGLGWYATTVGLTGLFASIVAGVLWDKIGDYAVFVFGAISAVAGIIGIALLVFPSAPKTETHSS